MSTPGYYRFPTIHHETIVFVSEDDLWTVPRAGGMARRLTSNLGAVTSPHLSPDGEWLAFVGREEGAPDIYLMPAAGGPARRLTYLAGRCQVVRWSLDGRSIIFSSAHEQPLARDYALYAVAADAANGAFQPLPYGPARSITYGADATVVLGRNTGDPAVWKRYRGGTTGHLWIDRGGSGAFERFLPDLDGNITSPMWVEGEEAPWVYFVSDHEGIGNLYRCRADGADLERCTEHEEYYVRNPSTDGRTIVYHAGADLYVYDVARSQESQVDIAYHSPRVQRNRKFVHAGRYLDDVNLHPTGRAMALTARGRSFAFFNFDGPVMQYGKRDGVRYRLATWLNDGRRMVMVSDEIGEETLEIHSTEPDRSLERLENLDIGRPVELKVSPARDLLALSNHRHELILVDLSTGAQTVVDRSPYRRIAGFDWSPDGRWLVYGYAATAQTTALRLCELLEPASGVDTASEAAGDPADPSPVEAGALSVRIHTITRPVLHDVAPSFDPEGKYIYFISHREFNPVYDGLHFDLGFPWGMRPYLLLLRDDEPNPFTPHPDLDDEDDEDDESAEEGGDEADEGPGDDVDDFGDDDGDDDDGDDDDGDDDDGDELDEYDEDDEEEYGVVTGRRRRARSWRFGMTAPPPESSSHAAGARSAHGEKRRAESSKTGERRGSTLRIDLDGIERRVLAFPVPDGRYSQIAGIKGKAIFVEFSIHGQLDNPDGWDDNDQSELGTLRAYNFKEYKSETLADGITWFDLSRNGKKLIYATGGRLRVVDAGEKAPGNSGPPRKSGWLDLNRVKVSVDPQSEWEQMYREAWRLQRDHFWTEDMADVDWQAVFNRYFPLIGRVSSRSEFSDLMWEMQGELGTSHAYEFGGDYRPSPRYVQGFLGATFALDENGDGYRISNILQGDSWDARANSPLADPGLAIQEGDRLVAINGQPLDAAVGPGQLLVNQAGQEVLLTLIPQTDGNASKQEPPEQGTTPEAAARLQLAVRTMASETTARYRQWVETCRRRVHEASQGRLGYVHIPDMGATGYAEFHRSYLAEIDREGLVVDVRYNGGGHVSQLILEKLARRRLGYDLSRWGGLMPYPLESVAGPLVALTNEHAGSDGDIFCHSFKLLKLGPLVGKRTWGGVIGIAPRHSLVDGTITTQPEYSFWFSDVGWSVENFGAEPDIEVEITPQDYAAGQDPQLESAIREGMRLLTETPVHRPDLTARPTRALPKLPRP